MLRMRVFSAAFIAMAAIGGVSAIALQPVPAYAEAKALSPAVGGPLKEASGLLKSNPRGALAKVQQAEAASGHSAYETLVINQMKVAAYNALGDKENAGKAAEAAMNSGQLPDKDRENYRNIVAQGYLASGNLDKFADFAKGNPDMMALLAQAYVKQNKFAQAQETMKQAIAQTGGTPKEEWLLIVYDAQRKGGDAAGASQTIEQLLRTHPKPDYWKFVLNGMLNQKGMKDDNKLDVYRLMYATNSFGGADDYTQMTETAIIANFPADGQRAMQKGFSAGVLGKGDQAAREKRLLDKATQTAQQDGAKLPAMETQAAAQADGNALAKVGETYLSLGQYDKAVTTLQQAIQKGVTDQAAAKLHLGIAYAGAKQNEKARQAWSGIAAKDVNKQLAGLWAITLR